MRLFSIFFFLFLSLFVRAQQIGGEKVFQFLNLSTSARQIALGGEVLTLTDDINQPLWNPASLNISLDRKLSINYSNYLADINIGSVSYATQLSRRFGMIYGNIMYLDYGTIIGADVSGIETGNFSAKDIAVSFGYSYNFPKSDFYFGTNLKFISSNISNFSSTAVAMDASLLYYHINKPYSFTLVLRNFGTQISTFNGIQERLPLKIALGGSYQLEHVPLRWYATIDNLQKWDVSFSNPSNQTTDLNGNITEEKVDFLGNTLRHFVLGAELFPESLVNVRLGYNFRRAAELKLQNTRTFSGVSFGFGIKMNRFKFNYAYSKFHAASNTSTFSLEFDLNTTH